MNPEYQNKKKFKHRHETAILYYSNRLATPSGNFANLEHDRKSTLKLKGSSYRL